MVSQKKSLEKWQIYASLCPWTSSLWWKTCSNKVQVRNTSAALLQKKCVSETLSNYEHCFLRRTHSKEVVDWLFPKIRLYSYNDANPTSVLVLEFKHLDNVACSWVTAMTLHYIWVKRMETGGRTSIDKLVMQLERSLNFMENTKFHNYNIFVIGKSIISSNWYSDIENYALI